MNSLIGFFKGLVPTRFLPSKSNIRESQALAYSQETALNTYIEQVLRKVRSELVLEIQAEDELLTEIIGKILRNIQLELNCQIRLSQLEEQHCEPKYLEITPKPIHRRETSTSLTEEKLEVTGEAVHDRQGPVIEEVVQKQALLYNISDEKITEVPEITELREDFLVHSSFESHLTVIEGEEDLYTEIETCATFGSVCSETATLSEEEDCSVHVSFETHLNATEDDLYTQLEKCSIFGSVSLETIKLCEEEDSVVHLPINNSPDVRQTEVFDKAESCINVGALPSESVSSDTEKDAFIQDVVDSVLNKIVNNLDREEVSGDYSLPKFSLSDNSMSHAGTSALRTTWIRKGAYSEPYLAQLEGVALQDTLSCPLGVAFPQMQPAKDTPRLKKTKNGKQKPHTENANARKRGSTYINSEAICKEVPKAVLKMVKVEKGCKGGNNSGEMWEIDDAGMTVFGKPVKKFKKAMKRKGDSSKDEKNAGKDSGTKTQDGSKNDGDKAEHRGAVGKKSKCDGTKNIASIKETCDTGKIKDETTITTTASNIAKQNDIVDTSAKDDVIQQKSQEALLMKDSGVNNQFDSTSKPLKNNISSDISKQQEATYHLKTPTSRLAKSKKRPLGKIPSLKKPKIVVRPTKGSHAARTVLPPGDSSGGKTTGQPNMAFGHKLPPIKDPDGMMVQGKKVSENKKPSGAKTKQRKYKTPQKPIWERYKKPVANIGECRSDTTASSTEVKKVTRLRRNKTISDPVTLMNENSGEQVANNNESETVDDKENPVKEEWACLCSHTDPPFEGNLLDLPEECSDHVETPVGNTVIHDVKRVEQIRRQLDMSEENIVVQSNESEPAQDNAQKRSLSGPTERTNANLATVTEEAECILIDLGEQEDAKDFEVEVSRQTQSEPCYFTFDLFSDFTDSLVSKSDSTETLVSEDLLLDLQDDFSKDNEPVLSTLNVPKMVITAPSSELILEAHDATRIQEQNTSPGDTVKVYKGRCQLQKTEPTNTPSASEKLESLDKLVTNGCSKAIANMNVQGEEKAQKPSETIKPNSRNSQVQPSEKSPKVGFSFPETKGDLNKLILMNLTEFGQKTLQQEVGEESAQSANTKTANETQSEVCEEPSKDSGGLETEVCADGGRALKSHGNVKPCKSNKSLPVHPGMTTTTTPEIDSGCLSLSANGSSLSLDPCLTIRSIRNNTNPDSPSARKTPQVKEEAQEPESARSADKSDQLLPGTDTLLVIQGKKKVGMPSSNKSFRLRTESLKKLNEEKNQEEAKPGAGSRKPKSAIRNKTRVISEKDQTASNGQESHETATGTTAEGKLLTTSTDLRLTKKKSNSCIRTHLGSSIHGLQPNAEKDEPISTKLSTGGDQTIASDLSACQVCNTQAISKPKYMTKNPYSLTEKPLVPVLDMKETCEVAKHYISTPDDKEGHVVLDEVKRGKSSQAPPMHKVAKGGRRHANKETCQKILQSYLEKREEFRALRQEDRHMRIIRWLCETNSHLPQSSPYFSAQVYFFNVELPGPRQQLWKSADEQDKDSRCSCVNNNGCLQQDRKTIDNPNEGGMSKYKPLLLSLLEAHRQRLIQFKPDITTTDLLMDKFPVLGPVLHQNPFRLISLNLQNKDRFHLQGELQPKHFWKSKPQLVMTQPQVRDTTFRGARTVSETCPANVADSRLVGQCNISAIQIESFTILLNWLIEKFQETSTFMLQNYQQEQQRASSVVLEDSISEEQMGWYSVIRSLDIEPNMDYNSGSELAGCTVKHRPDSTSAQCDKLDSLIPKCAVQATCSSDPKLSNGCDETTEIFHAERQDYHKSGGANRTSYEQCTSAVSQERQCPRTQISVAKKGEATTTGQLFEMTDLSPCSNESKRRKLRIFKKGSTYNRNSCLKTSEVKNGSSASEDTDCPDVRNASGRKRRVAGLFDCLSDRTCRSRGV